MELMDIMGGVEQRLRSTSRPGNRNNDNPGLSSNKDGNNAQGGHNSPADVENSINGEPHETCRQFMERIM